MQITVHPADHDGRRAFTVHARTGGEHAAAAWTLHASGVLSADQPAGGWPAGGAARVSRPIDAGQFLCAAGRARLPLRRPVSVVAWYRS